jgi:hypothetical protein
MVHLEKGSEPGKAGLVFFASTHRYPAHPVILSNEFVKKRTLAGD